MIMQKEEIKQKYSLEMYKIAFERLQFQDDYIFKFSALFVTFNGALGYAWKEIFVDNLNNQYDMFLYLIALFGIFVCFTWFMWIKQNDYWHSVWKGCLKNIEKEILNESSPAYLFNADHEKVARSGGRCKPFLKGHHIASL